MVASLRIRSHGVRMAGKTIPHHMYKQVLHQYRQSAPIKQAARLLGISRNTVRRYYRQLQESSVEISELMGLEEPELHVWFNPQRDLDVDHQRYMDLSGRVPSMLDQLGQPGVTKQLLWEEYLAEQPNGYGYSQFCHWLNVLGAPHRASMMQDVAAGQALYVDFAGRTMDVIDPQTGQVHRQQLFVATMGYSYLTYVEALPSQRVVDFIGALDRAIRYFGGVPKSIVCDNFKSAVVRADRYEPTIQQSLADLAAHYGTTILPARVAHPQDKSRVELSVRYVYLRVLGPLRRRQFFSHHDLASVISEHIEAASQRVMRRYGVSRRMRFEQDEAPTLAKLPDQHFELKHRRRLKVQKNNHVYLAQDKTYYSVPYSCIGSQVEVIYTATLVKIFHLGQCVATHRRTHTPHTHCTVKEHMPAAHQSMLSRHTQQYLQWAEATKSAVISILVHRLLHSRQHPEQAYRSCDGIRALYRQYGMHALEQACNQAIELDQCSYGFLSRYLRTNHSQPPVGTAQNQQGSASIPMHDNIRGRTYYANSHTPIPKLS